MKDSIELITSEKVPKDEVWFVSYGDYVGKMTRVNFEPVNITTEPQITKWEDKNG